MYPLEELVEGDRRGCEHPPHDRNAESDTHREIINLNDVIFFTSTQLV
jgi:hypothetical protein